VAPFNQYSFSTSHPRAVKQQVRNTIASLYACHYIQRVQYPYVEAGVEEALDVSAIGGLLPFKALVGYAVPILGEGTGVFYFGFSL